MFNALKYTEELEKAGFSQEQAKATVRILVDTMEQNFATKHDLRELDHRIETLQREISHQFERVEFKLTVKLGSMLVLGIGIVATLVKLL